MLDVDAVKPVPDQARVVKVETAGQGDSGSLGHHHPGLAAPPPYAPVADARYARAAVVEHGIGGSRTAAPIAED